MGGPLKCKLKEGGGRIIRSFYKCDVVSRRPLERIPNTRYAKRVYKVSIAFLGKYRTTVNANCIELPNWGERSEPCTSEVNANSVCMYRPTCMYVINRPVAWRMRRNMLSTCCRCARLTNALHSPSVEACRLLLSAKKRSG